MINSVCRFREKLLGGLRELDTEYQVLKHETDLFTEDLEETKIRYHNVTKRVAKLEKFSGFAGDPKISVEKGFPLKDDTVEKTGLYYY